jgi:hypothetical protein
VTFLSCSESDQFPLNLFIDSADEGYVSQLGRKLIDPFRVLSRQIIGAAGAAAIFLASHACADEKFETLVVGSTTYSNVTVLNKTRTDLFITHSWGMANIKVRDLDQDAQIKLGYLLPQDKRESKSFFKVPEVVAKLDTGFKDDQQRQEAEMQLAAQAGPFLDYIGNLDDRVAYGIVGGIAFVYLTFCFLCRQICKKTGQKPSPLIWMPLLKQFPMLKAAGMPAGWFLLNFIGLWGIRSIVWCFKISTARGKHWTLGLLLLLPVTNLLAFLYLAFSSGLDPDDVSSPKSTKLVLFGGGEKREAA